MDKRLLLIPLAILLVITSFFVFSGEDCDINKDGIVEDKERELCGTYSTDYIDTTVEGIAVRFYLPEEQTSSPIIIYVPGGYEEKDLTNGLPIGDMVVALFLFPGVEDKTMNKASEGVYDFRGEDSIAVFKEVVDFCAGNTFDINGDKITDLIPYALTDNVGAIGVSNGGNLPVAAAASYELDLNYIIQWETPVSSQVATRDLGEIILEPLQDNPSPRRGEFFNPRYEGYGLRTIQVDYSDLTYDPNSLFEVFHDGNGDGEYTTTLTNAGPSPDLNQDGVLSLDEDFPLDFYPDQNKGYYSRPVTHALFDNGVLTLSNWPSHIATPTEAEDYWGIREAVQLYGEAMENNPDLKAMVLANVEDHVQSNPYKSHVRQAFDGWNNNGAWVQINPDLKYVLEVDSSLTFYTIENKPNVAPDWEDLESYCVPESIDAEIYQQAAVYQMADQ
jgi:hypothetical protein